jgi:hypothetical protein
MVPRRAELCGFVCVADYRAASLIASHVNVSNSWDLSISGKEV